MLDTETRVPFQAAFRRDVLSGLSRSPKTLPARWLYDDQGSALFETITRLPEYYPTRTETAILTTSAAEIAQFGGDFDIASRSPGRASRSGPARASTRKARASTISSNSPTSPR